jgi:hypothetical protein
VSHDPRGDGVASREWAEEHRAAARKAIVRVLTASDYAGIWSVPIEPHAEQIADRLLDLGFDREQGPWGCGCHSCIACAGNCGRCGRRDMDPELGLCKPCDEAVSAEAAGVSVSGGGEQP